MPSPLHRSPLGLLPLFGLQTLGRSPTQFGDLVAPVVDVGDMYGADRLTNAIVTGAAGASPRTLSLTSPFGSAIKLHAFSAEIVLGAGPAANANFTAIAQILDPVGNTSSIFSGAYLVGGIAYAAGTSLVVGGQLPYPRVIPPGWTLRIVWQFTDPAVTHLPQIRFQFENIIAI